MNLRILAGIVLLWFASLLAASMVDLPPRGDPQAPAHQHVAPDYVLHAEEDMETPNVVTAILADYRGYDTLGETTVIFTAGLACWFVLFRRKHAAQD